MLPTAAAVLSLILLNLKLDKTLENMFSPWYFSQEPCVEFSCHSL
jgi:hypothetical protein